MEACEKRTGHVRNCYPIQFQDYHLCGNRPSWWLEAGVSAATMIRSFIATYGPSAGQARGEKKTQDFDPGLFCHPLFTSRVFLLPEGQDT